MKYPQDLKNNKTKSLQAEVCVVGTGPAGSVLASALARSGISVVVLEGGSDNFTDASQAMYDGRVTVGTGHFENNFSPLSVSRLRFIGGSSNHWSGRIAPFSRLDFEKDWFSSAPGWPIGFSEINQYYPMALKELSSGEYAFNDIEQVCKRLIPFDRSRVVNRLYQWGPPVYFKKYLATACANYKNIVAYYNANLVGFKVVDNSISCALFASIDKTSSIEVVAKKYVLALGGIENARFLLGNKINGTDSKLIRSGIPVGKYFMEHPVIVAGMLNSITDVEILREYSNIPIESKYMGVNIKSAPYIRLSDHAAYKNKINLSSIQLATPYAFESEGAEVLNNLLHDFKEFNFKGFNIDNILKMIGDYDSVAESIIRRLSKGRFYGRYPLMCMAEQEPSEINAIKLNGDLDSFGRQRVSLQWTQSTLDMKSVRDFVYLLSEELIRLNVARIKITDFVDSMNVNIWNSNSYCRGHHMGATRMGLDPKYSVVDKNLRVHDFNNLFVAGSSVFPSSSCVNPTLTIVALSLRLKDHLLSLLKNV